MSDSRPSASYVLALTSYLPSSAESIATFSRHEPAAEGRLSISKKSIDCEYALMAFSKSSAASHISPTFLLALPAIEPLPICR